MKERTKRVFEGVAKAVRYGLLVALGIAALAFVFGFLTDGLNALIGLEWVRRILFVLAAFCLIVGGAGLLFAGSPRRDASLGLEKGEALSSFEHAVGISWATALVVAAVDFLLVGSVADLLVIFLS